MLSECAQSCLSQQWCLSGITSHILLNILFVSLGRQFQHSYDYFALIHQFFFNENNCQNKHLLGCIE